MNDDRRHGQRAGIDPERTKAAREMLRDIIGRETGHWLSYGHAGDIAGKMLEAAFPELVPEIFDGLPFAWIAPREPTQAMWAAGAETQFAKRFVRLVEAEDSGLVGQPVSAPAHGGAMASQVYRAMRDAHLKEKQT